MSGGQHRHTSDERIGAQASEHPFPLHRVLAAYEHERGSHLV
jgi:hypothetical protein